MSDTVEIACPSGEWTSIAAAETAGLVTNSMATQLFMREAASQPADAVNKGHPLDLHYTWNFSMAAGQQLWVKPAADTAGEVTVTVDS